MKFLKNSRALGNQSSVPASEIEENSKDKPQSPLKANRIENEKHVKILLHRTIAVSLLQYIGGLVYICSQFGSEEITELLMATSAL